MSSPYASKFWKKSWDQGLKDLDPKLWNISFVDAMKKTFSEYSNKVALAFEGVEVTFGDLDKYSNQFANMLIKNGFKKGDVVGINLANIPEYVISLVGTLKAGCIVSGVSPLLSDVQMQYQLADLGSGGKQVGLVTLDAIFAARVTKIASTLPQLKLVVATSVIGFLPKWKQKLALKLKKDIPRGEVTPLPGITVLMMHADVLDIYPTDFPKIDIKPNDICFIQYTGGTTGPPKGAMLSHSNAVSDLLITQEWISWKKGAGVALSGFPFFHIAGLFFCENCLYLGWMQVLIPNPRDTDLICKEIKKYRPTALVNVPSLFQMLLANPKFKTLDHSNLDVCISAAAPFPKESQQILEAAIGKGKLMEVYGMTETSPLTSMNPYRGKRVLGSIGLPLLNTDLKLCDPATGKEVKLGEAGEICTKGPMVMIGYYNKPEETAKSIDEDGFMHTGDVAIMDEEGYMRIVDRTKDMIIVSGYKVFSTKVEDSLCKHPAIEMVALIGVADKARAGSEIVKAFIKVKSEYKVESEAALKEDITKFAKEHLAPYEVPKFIEIVKEIPLTAVGKIDKKVLRAQEKK